MLTDDDKQQIRAIVSEVVARELCTFALAINRGLVVPLEEHLAEMAKSLSIIIDGQLLVEKSLAHLTDDPEPWQAD